MQINAKFIDSGTAVHHVISLLPNAANSLPSTNHIGTNSNKVSFLAFTLAKFLKNKYQLCATYYFIALLIGSTYFGHYYAHHQELTTIIFIITLVVSFCKDGRGSVNVKLWLLVVYVQ